MRGPRREPQTHGLEHRSNDLEAAIDVAADQQLLGGEALELHSLRRRHVFGRLQIGICGLRRASGIGQRGRQTLASSPDAPEPPV